MSKIILFYKYVHLENPKRTLKWQRQICENLGLKGRIILAQEGINATLGGTIENVERYKKIMDASPEFAGIDFKESEGGAESFPRMRIVVKNEILNLQADPAATDLKNTGVHLTPQQVHDLIQSKPENLVILDGRNYFEARIGKFTNAIVPEIDHFRDFPKYIDEHADEFKDKQVLMYCTGGIRCERATALLKSKGVAQEVYQIKGGIHRYIEQFPDGFFRGKNYVFDNRLALKANDDILGQCDVCQTPCDDFTNCFNATCNKHFISCANCMKELENTCSLTCKELVATAAVKKRPSLQKSVQSSCGL